MKRKCLSIMACLGIVVPLFVTSPALAATSPTLLGADSYSVLSGAAVTNAGPTTVAGNLGVSPGIGPLPHVSGFPPGIVSLPGAIHDADVSAAAAQADNTAAFTSLDQICTTTYAGTQDLVGLSLVPGVYCADAFRLTGTLTLTGSGVWIFKSASDLVTSGTANVVGGDPCNVWWRAVSSATLGVHTSLIGNVLASTAITMATGATLNGRAMTQTAAVTLDTNTISGPVCSGNGGGGTTPPGVTPGVPPIPVPTLPEWAIIMLMALLAMAGFAAMRRRSM